MWVSGGEFAGASISAEAACLAFTPWWKHNSMTILLIVLILVALGGGFGYGGGTYRNHGIGLGSVLLVVLLVTLLGGGL